MSLAPADTGVPGIVESMRPAADPAPLPVVLDVIPKSVVTILGVLLVADDRRRWLL